MYEELFHEAWEHPERTYQNVGIARGVLGALMNEAGYRFQEATAPLTDMPMPPDAVELLFEARDVRTNDAQMGIIFKDVTFAVDAEAGTVTCELVPHGVSPEQAAPEEAQKALERMPRTVTFRASPEMKAQMDAHKDAQLGYAEESREGMRRFREYAATRIGQQLTAEDYRSHWDFLRYLPFPYDLQDGYWTIEKPGLAWRIVIWDKNQKTGVQSIRDIFEFQDGE